jgi:hypothetical protein
MGQICGAKWGKVGQMYEFAGFTIYSILRLMFRTFFLIYGLPKK